MSSQYGGLFQIRDFSAEDTARQLERVSLTAGRNGGGYDERWLQQLVASHPQALPIEEIEVFLTGAVPVCLELATNAGPIDLLLVSPRGGLVVVECKLWRNPQARREVVGQIIDYAKELPRLSYEAFEAAICKAVPVGGATKADGLYARAGGKAPELDEPSFIDAVSRNLRRGRFLLLIVGDGIQEGVESIAEFLQQHAGMHFTLGLVEVAVYKSELSGYLVQPRVLMKTRMVSRGVVTIDDDRVAIQSDVPQQVTGSPSGGRSAVQSTPKVPSTISEAGLYETFDAKVPSGASRLRQFTALLEAEGLAAVRLTATYIILEQHAGDRTIPLGILQADRGDVWFDTVVNVATSLGRRDAALRYYKTLANLIADEKERAKKVNPATKTGTASLPADDLLSRQPEWLAAIQCYLGAISDGAESSGSDAKHGGVS
jgi:hypothetical protein